MANLGARQADLATAVGNLKTVVLNCATDIAAGDSDSDAIDRIMQIAQSALESAGFNQGDFKAPTIGG